VILRILLATVMASTSIPAPILTQYSSEGSWEQLVAGCDAKGNASSLIVNVEAASNPADTAQAIQLAIDSAYESGGGTVQLDAEHLTLGRPIVMKDNVGLRGRGAKTVLKAGAHFLETQGPHGGHPLITTSGASNVTIGNLTADQSGDVLDGNSAEGRLNEYLIDVRGSTNILVEDVHTKNPFTYSIAIVGSNNFCVRQSTTTVGTSGKYDQLDGIHILDSYKGVVTGNQVDQGTGSDGDDGLIAHTIGGTVHDVTFEGNTVRGGRHGSALQIAVGRYSAYNLKILNNRLWGSPNGVVTGYYDGNAPIEHVAVSGNTFVDTAGPSVDFFGDLSNISVTDNQLCRSGKIHLPGGNGNSASGNVISC
jgi:hypothetical protein